MNTNLVFLCLSQIYLLITIGRVNAGGYQYSVQPGIPPQVHASMPPPSAYMNVPPAHVPYPPVPTYPPAHGAAYPPAHGAGYPPPHGAAYPPPHGAAYPPHGAAYPSHGAAYPPPHMQPHGVLPHSPSYLGHSGSVSHGATTTHKTQYTHTETFTQADNMVVNQYGMPTISPVLGHFHSFYRGLQLKLKSALKSDKISEKALMVLQSIHMQPGYMQVIADIGQHEVLRHAILGSFNYPCIPGVHSMDWNCSYDCYYALVCSLHGNPYLLRKFFIVVKNCPGMLMNSYSVNPNWVNKINHHTTTHTTTSTESHMASNQHAMGYGVHH